MACMPWKGKRHAKCQRKFLDCGGFGINADRKCRRLPATTLTAQAADLCLALAMAPGVSPGIS